MKKLLLYSVIGGALFILFPFAIALLGDIGKQLFVALLLLINPVFTLISGIFVAGKNKIGLFYPLVVGLVFILAVFIHYNSTAIPYAFFYLAAALVGVLIGYFTTKKKSEINKMRAKDL